MALFGLFEQDVEHLLQVGHERFLEYLGGLAVDLDVLFLLLGFHVIVRLAQLVHEDDHVLVLADLLHHESVDFLITDGHSVHFLEFGEDFEQLSLEFNQWVYTWLACSR